MISYFTRKKPFKRICISNGTEWGHKRRSLIIVAFVEQLEHDSSQELDYIFSAERSTNTVKKANYEWKRFRKVLSRVDDVDEYSIQSNKPYLPLFLTSSSWKICQRRLMYLF